ncbi:mechanosensitive ion channel family protein [Rhodoplanes elegans]|uniref:mechanosensitive ion channel family protein n=1 Tax=Rhodoplanes elegans TaxID=29408 RepID=UPI001FD309DF|nr:mechanosensitive ion channel domain-containing protein [Rhodoplanes elegans]
MGLIDNLLAATLDVLSKVPGIVVGLVVLAFAVVLVLALHALVGRLLRRIFRARPFVLTLLQRSRGPTRLATVIFVVAVLLPALPFDSTAADIAVKLLGVVFVMLLGWIAMIAVDLGAAFYMRGYRSEMPNDPLARKHLTQVRILRRVAAILVVVVTAAAALMNFETVRQYGVSLFASAGAAGLVVGLAARPLFSNLIAGVQLAMTQPIRLGDAVIVEGEWGEIEEITSTYVVVRIWDLRRLIVPLTYFIEKPFQNWTRENPALFGAVMLYVDYAVPVDRLRAKLEEIAKGSALWDGRVCALQVTDATERTMELRALVSARTAGEAFDLRCDVRERMIAFLREAHPEGLPHVRAEVAGHPDPASPAHFAAPGRTADPTPSAGRPSFPAPSHATPGRAARPVREPA